MITQSMVFGPDEDGETVVVQVENGSVEHVFLQDSDEQQIPFKVLTKAQWHKMHEAEDQALERIERETETETERVTSETDESVPQIVP